MKAVFLFPVGAVSQEQINELKANGNIVVVGVFEAPHVYWQPWPTYATTAGTYTVPAMQPITYPTWQPYPHYGPATNATDKFYD